MYRSEDIMKKKQTEGSTMKKVVLLGDSIRLIGYGTPLAEKLKDEFEFWQPENNSRFANYLLRQVFDFHGKIEEADIIHFNAGHWDLCELFGDGTFTPIDTYRQTVERLADLFLKEGKKVIFATTTPVRPENPYNRNEVVEAFNAAVVPALQEKGVIINDLYTPVAADIYTNICEDNIHLSDTGIALCVEKTAELLRKAKGI